MKSKPSWGLWLTWVIAYTALDFVIAYILHGSFHRSDIKDAVEGAVAGGTITWLFALYRWHKADTGL